MSVGLACLPTHIFKSSVVFSFIGASRSNRSRARSRLRCRRWSSWNCCEPSLLSYLVLDKGLQHLSFNDCWSCAPLTHIFIFFSLQVPRWERLDGHNPTKNLNADQTVVAVRPKIEPIYEVLVIYFIECWSCAPLSHVFSSFFLPGILAATRPSTNLTATNSRVPYLRKYLLWSN